MRVYRGVRYYRGRGGFETDRTPVDRRGCTDERQAKLDTKNADLVRRITAGEVTPGTHLVRSGRRGPTSPDPKPAQTGGHEDRGASAGAAIPTGPACEVVNQHGAM